MRRQFLSLLNRRSTYCANGICRDHGEPVAAAAFGRNDGLDAGACYLGADGIGIVALIGKQSLDAISRSSGKSGAKP